MVDLSALVDAIQIAFTVDVLLWIAIGVMIGLGVGALPGLTGSTAIALALPLTFGLDISSVIGLVIGIYKGVMFGGSISAITFSTPGTPDAAPLIPDSEVLRKQGKSRKTLHMALYSSVSSDMLSDILTILIAPMFALVALAFGPSERFWLMIMAISLIGALTGSHFAKGLMAAGIGLFLASIGSDPISSVARNTFDIWWLSDGIGLIPLVIGLFAVAKVIEDSVRIIAGSERVVGAIAAIRQGAASTGPNLTVREFVTAWREMGIGFAIGSFVGIMPGLGASVATWLSFGLTQRLFPKKKIGQGRLEGIAAVESANSATVGPALVPLLTFGIPGGAIAALIGAALSLQGVTPGPRMFELFPTVIYTLFAVLLIGNVFNLVIARLLCDVYARLSQLPAQIMLPAILVMAVAGTYTFSRNPYDILVMLAFGVFGYGLRVLRIPEAPLIITFLLAPMAEANLRRALLINRGDWEGTLFNSPLSLGLIGGTVLLVTLFAVSGLRAHAKARRRRSANADLRSE